MCGLAANQDDAYRELNLFLMECKEEQQMQSYRYQQLVKRNKTPEQFWALDGAEWPQLQRTAQKIFSLIASSASCERSFSAMGFVHSKLRNRLCHNTIEKLVFVRSNRLLAQVNEEGQWSSEEEPDQEVDDDGGHEDDDDQI